MKFIFGALRGAVVPAMLIASLAAANAQPYPNRPIHVISPYPAGSASDTVTRVVMDQVSQLIGQPVIIDNKNKVSAPEITIYRTNQSMFTKGRTTTVIAEGNAFTAAPPTNDQK